MQRDVFLAISTLLAQILLVTVAHYKSKTQHLKARMKQLEEGQGKPAANAGAQGRANLQPQDMGK